MAAAGILLAAHDGHMIGACARDEFLDSGPIARMPCQSPVIDVPLAHDAIVVAGRVGRTATEGISHPVIDDRCAGKACLKRRSTEVGYVAAVWLAADIDQRGDLVLAQEFDKILGSVIAVADGEHARWLSMALEALW